jgi:hypothetical protein
MIIHADINRALAFDFDHVLKNEFPGGCIDLTWGQYGL